jgi:molybdenum cofactor biosynthesis protein B
MVDFQSRDTRRRRDDADRARSDDGTDADRETDVETDAGTAAGDDRRPVAYAVVTVTGDRSLDEDDAGDAVVEAIEAAGSTVATRELLAPSYDGVQTALDALVGRRDVDAIVTVGGTGVEPDDVAVDAALDLFGKVLPGFGELFRALSRDDEGTAVVGTRTTAGVVDDVPVFCLPGDPAAARRGVEDIVVAEAADLVAAASGGASE